MLVSARSRRKARSSRAITACRRAGLCSDTVSRAPWDMSSPITRSHRRARATTISGTVGGHLIAHGGQFGAVRHPRGATLHQQFGIELRERVGECPGARRSRCNARHARAAQQAVERLDRIARGAVHNQRDRGGVRSSRCSCSQVPSDWKFYHSTRADCDRCRHAAPVSTPAAGRACGSRSSLMPLSYAARFCAAADGRPTREKNYGRAIRTNEFRSGMRSSSRAIHSRSSRTNSSSPARARRSTASRSATSRPGRTIERTFNPATSLEAADVMDAEMQYLYSDGDFWHFMVPDNFEQYTADKAVVGDNAHVAQGRHRAASSRSGTTCRSW